MNRSWSVSLQLKCVEINQPVVDSVEVETYCVFEPVQIASCHHIAAETGGMSLTELYHCQEGSSDQQINIEAFKEVESFF